MAKRKKGDPTPTNLWVLKSYFGDEDAKPNGLIPPPDVPHMRRCLKAGLFTVDNDGMLRLTDAGREAIRNARL